MKKDKKKGITSFSNITDVVKVRHISDKSIARCNRIITPILIENAKERQRMKYCEV